MSKVQWLKLGEVCAIYTGQQFNKRDMQEVGTYPVINGGIEASGYADVFNEPENTITISQGGASAGYVNWITEKFYAGAHCYVVRPEAAFLENRYLYFLLKNQEMNIMQAKHGAGIPGLNREKVKALLLALPPVDKQREIIDILDRFTSLTASLTAEKELRVKQYNYYREQLLTFDTVEEIASRTTNNETTNAERVKWVSLGEVVKIKHGKDWKNLGAGDVPVYGSGGIMGYVDTCSYNKPTVLIPRKGSITNIFYCDTPFWNVDTIFYTEIDSSKMFPKFLYYFIKTMDLMTLDTGSGRPSLTQAILKKIKIPIPSLAEQKRIVAILDKFSAYCQDITQGLPAEIAARQKQYAYYRNKLLSFENGL